MAIGMIELHGTIQRTQDFSVMKHHEDMKMDVEQSHYQLQSDKKVNQKANQIQKGDDSDKSENHADAREKGKNTYAGDGGQNRKKQEMPESGKVILKGTSHFDMSV